MAPVASSSKKGFLSLAEKSLNTKPKSGVNKRRSHGREGTRTGLRKVIKRGMKKGARVAMTAYEVAKETGMLKGVPGMVADALVNTTIALLGISSPQHMSTPNAGGWNLELEASQNDNNCSFALSVSKSPEFSAELHFRSPVDLFIRPGKVEVRKSAGRSHTQGRAATPGGANSFVSPGASVTDLVSRPQFGAHGSLIEATPPGFVNVPLTPSQTEPNLLPRIKMERTPPHTEPVYMPPRIKMEKTRIKQEVP
ncbi:hypothetical protein E2C01_059548 [Portunus trituberculatus]|uniref:Uncharacterized protein n=1 Tax=Portunus trituberculatus TaxID=210409 RepID=A0A5B7H9C7_PORTR|nr:hypothetical protein [Portunus trituberculatus]